MAEVTNNLARAVSLSSDGFKFSATIGVFAGSVSLSVFDNAVKSAPIIKILFNPTSVIRFRTILQKILSDSESKPIEFGYHPRNWDLKVNEFKGAITVGRDQEKCIYFDVIGDKHKEPIRFYLITDTATRINGMELSKLSQTEAGCNTIFELMKMLLNASLSSPIIKKNDGMNTSNNNNNQSYSVGNDVPLDAIGF